MKLSRLAQIMEAAYIRGAKDPIITGLCEDSRLVKRGDVFFALDGSKVDGAAFAAKATAGGAVAVVAQDTPLPDLKVPQVVVADARKALASAAHAFFKNPSAGLTVVGVTGTKGKTTTSFLIRSVLSAAGYPCGLMGTVSYETGKRSIPAPNTTPSSLTVEKLLAEMRANRLKAVSMEVSSHALELERVADVEFDAAVFTNLSREHLDFHHTFQKYYLAKRRLFFEFPSVKVRVVNADDAWGQKLLRELGPKGVGFGIRKRCAFHAENVVIEPHRVCFKVQGHPFEAPLSGRFNVYNALAAISVLRGLGISWGLLQDALRTAPAPPGRFERVEAGQPFTVLVDYAHSPAALKEALREARHLAGRKGRVLSVFGCGGERDRTKRPVMGHLSATLADLTYVTSDNPRSENPISILKEVLSGVPKSKDVKGPVHAEVDRGIAIRKVLHAAESGDVVLIAGKGHETYQIVGEKKIHFDDRETAREVLKSL
jgi:UDP-N-acetylmuramyl-tripeptide synthetase